jgi:hypothetical protein
MSSRPGSAGVRAACALVCVWLWTFALGPLLHLGWHRTDHTHDSFGRIVPNGAGLAEEHGPPHHDSGEHHHDSPHEHHHHDDSEVADGTSPAGDTANPAAESADAGVDAGIRSAPSPDRDRNTRAAPHDKKHERTRSRSSDSARGLAHGQSALTHLAACFYWSAPQVLPAGLSALTPRLLAAWPPTEPKVTPKASDVHCRGPPQLS